MTPLAAVVGGGAAGLAGAALAHVLATIAVRHGAAAWGQGPYGAPFFAAALYTGVFYGAIGAAVRKPASAAIGFFGGFLGILTPMYVLTRYGGWSAAQWPYAVGLVYAAVIWTTIAGIGAAAAKKPGRGALAAVFGSLAGYAVLTVALKVFSSWAKAPWSPERMIPSPVNLIDGLLSGAGLCLALSVHEKLSRRLS